MLSIKNRMDYFCFALSGKTNTVLDNVNYYYILRFFYLILLHEPEVNFVRLVEFNMQILYEAVFAVFKMTN